MNSSLRDSLLIGAALITILGCGFGLGRLSPRQEIPLAPTVPAESLSEKTVAALRSALDLTPDQEKEIGIDLENLNSSILDSRHHALLEYYQSLLKFHDDIAPKLNPRQQEILEANRHLLEKEQAARFPQQS